MIKERMPVSKAPERKPERKREPAVAESGQNQPRKEPANIGELHALQASLENLLNWSISKKASQAEINERKKALERVDEEIQTLEDEIVNIENPGLRDKRTKVEPHQRQTSPSRLSGVDGRRGPSMNCKGRPPTS